MIYLLMPNKPSTQLKIMVEAAIKGKEFVTIQNSKELPDLRNKKILFAVDIDCSGVNITLLEMLSVLSSRGKDALIGSTGALIIHSSTELYTKAMGANIIFLANELGCSFIGHPLVEATGELKNFRTWQKNMDLTLEEISLELSNRLVNRLVHHKPIKLENPKLAYLHSSSRATSNTLRLWQMVEGCLDGWSIEEVHVKNGSVFDCFGCSYKACLEYGKKNSCFYGDIMTDKITSIIGAADILVWICPNYNDSISSNLIAVINRLTTLYRQMSFHNKMIFGVIVSGNSGSDSIAKQLIGALNINKGFYLPPYFSLMETANDAGSILKVENIEEKAKLFAHQIKYNNYTL